MEWVLVIFTFALRVLLIWQLAALVHNIDDKQLKGVALTGMFIYVGYIVWGVLAGIPLSPILAIGISGLLLCLLASNKYIKKLRGDC